MLAQRIRKRERGGVRVRERESESEGARWKGAMGVIFELISSLVKTLGPRPTLAVRSGTHISMAFEVFCIAYLAVNGFGISSIFWRVAFCSLLGHCISGVI
jgi:hypothetical protein